MMRYVMSYGVALLLILVIAGWLASGTLIEGGKGSGQGERAIIDMIEPEEDGPVRRLFRTIGLIETAQANADTPDAASAEAAPQIAPEPETAQLQSVRYVNFNARLMPINVEVRGQTQSNARVSVRAETSGIVKQVHVTKGQRVVGGDLLCSLARGTREAKLAQSQAALAQSQAALARAQADFDTNLTLREKGLSPANTARQFEVSLIGAKASVRAAIATLDDIKNDLDNTEVRTEISGVVEGPLAAIGDMLATGGVCATIVQLDPMLFAGKVAEARISLLKVGMDASVTVVTGQTVQGKVRFVSASAQRETRAFEIEIELDNSSRQLLDGVSATATIMVGASYAQLIPQSALTLETDGSLGVRILLDDVVSFRPVQIIGDDAGGVWVAGLAQNVKVITLGQEYVTDGQRVVASLATEESASQ